MEKKQLSFLIKDLKLDVKQEKNEMTFSGYASVFGNVDHTNDIVLKGAFTKSISERMPKLCYQHSTYDVVGVISYAKEDDYGLYVEGKFCQTQLGKDVYTLIKDGAIDQMSIGYVTKECDYENNIRLLKEVMLYEVSFVTFPANERAKITAVKSAPETIRDFEQKLKQIGLSQKQAKIVAKNSWSLIQRDVEDEASSDEQRDVVENNNAELKEALQNLLTILKK